MILIGGLEEGDLSGNRMGLTSNTLDLNENLMGLSHWDGFLEWLKTFEAIPMGETKDGLKRHDGLLIFSRQYCLFR